jgi:ABC-type multidrug transport system fused ATPase/permease subunit
MESKSLMYILFQIWKHINPKRRQHFIVLLILTIIASLAEVVSLGSVLPFIGILTQPDKVYNSPWMAEFIELFNVRSKDKLLLLLAIGFGTLALLAGVFRLVLVWFSFRLSNATGCDLSVEVYKRTLYQPYLVHLERSSSEIISGITHKVALATSILIATVTVITSLFLFISIIFTLIFIDPITAIVGGVSFGLAYLVVAVVTKPYLIANSIIIAKEQTYVVRALQEGLGAIRDVLLDCNQKVYVGIYKNAVLKLQKSSSQNSFLSQAPRYAMETFGMMLIAGFVIVLSGRPGGVTGALPILAMLGLGAQRLLPIMQQIYGNWSVIIGSMKPMKEVVDLLNQPLPANILSDEHEPMKVSKLIQLKGISFRYKKEMGGTWILNNINLDIEKGSRIGFIGKTGSGKSTILDIIMGLIEPEEGGIIVDGVPIENANIRSWQMAVAHVPQSIFLSDATIAENIAFGVPRDLIDQERLLSSARQASLEELILNKPKGFDTIVGERGVKLSGGQRQRIGIARALYKQATVLIFDEATSALDSETESSVMSSIENLSNDLTIIIVAHRITTLKSCKRIIKIENGKLFGSYSFEELQAIN